VSVSAIGCGFFRARSLPAKRGSRFLIRCPI
jgi:hypothetical protein